jgi:hypothetical protein
MPRRDQRASHDDTTRPAGVAVFRSGTRRHARCYVWCRAYRREHDSRVSAKARPTAAHRDPKNSGAQSVILCTVRCDIPLYAATSEVTARRGHRTSASLNRASRAVDFGPRARRVSCARWACARQARERSAARLRRSALGARRLVRRETCTRGGDRCESECRRASASFSPMTGRGPLPGADEPFGGLAQRRPRAAST